MIYCLLYYSTHDLNWEIKLKPEEWGQICGKAEAGKKMGVKGTRKCRQLGGMASWSQPDLRGLQRSTTPFKMLMTAERKGRLI